MSDRKQNEANKICPVCLDTLVDKSIKKINIKKAMKSRPFTKFLLKKTNENHVQLLTTFVLLLFSISEKYESSVFPIMNCIVLYHTYRNQI